MLPQASRQCVSEHYVDILIREARTCLLMAARALDLDCGPMSGGLHDVVDAEFFPGDQVRSNVLNNIGHRDPASVRPRAARFDFDDICQIL
ncbi:hypothetical protein AB4099_14020 [Bosea sp. 2KB_26]|uniref:hypothetical protein n=1 Tax=Bosea sp. 2KB_26 TaxID=3237475 RepID=UPI003F8FD0E1